MTIYLTDSVVVFFVWWWVVVCKHETVSQGEIVSLQFDKSHPILQERGNDMKLNDTKIKISTRLEIKTLAFITKGVAVQGNIGIWNVFTTRYR